MASQIDFYTTSATLNARIVSATSAATGYSADYLVDGFYSGTYWKPTSTANQAIVIDCAEAVLVSTLYLALNNYTVDLSNSSTAIVVLSTSWDGTSWTERANVSLANPYNVTRTGNGRSLYRAVNLSSAVASRYWKVEFKTMGVVIEVAELFLCCKYPSIVGHSVVESNTRKFRNLAHVNEGAFKYITSDTLNGTDELGRTFDCELQTRWDALDAIWQAARGNVTPVVMVNGTVNQDERLVRFPQTLARTWKANQYYSSEVTFMEEAGMI